jgi:hypothetical protein
MGAAAARSQHKTLFSNNKSTLDPAFGIWVLLDPYPTPNPAHKRRLSDIKRMSAAMRSGQGTLAGLEEHLAFMNEFMYKVQNPGGGGAAQKTHADRGGSANRV